MNRHNIKKTLLWALIFTPFVIFILPILVGLILTHPKRRKTEETPADYGLAYDEVEFKSDFQSVTLRGWWIPSKIPTTNTVITAHGYTDERSQKTIQSLRLIQKLHDSNVNVLMFDFRNSGKSGGRSTGIGYYEQHDLTAAVDFVLKSKGQSSVILLGWSMGAATSLLVGSRHPFVKGVIADSPFHDLQTYLEENLNVWSKLPKKPFTPIIIQSMKHLLRIDPKTVSPILEVQKGHNTSYLLIHGKNDERVPFTSSQLILAQIPKESEKTIWLTDYGHITSYQEEPKEYEQKILAFINNTFTSEEEER
ncbi:alpha/beta hydrolase [Bacillus sp. JJ664]